MTTEEALLRADQAHDTNTLDAVALTKLAAEVRRQHAEIERLRHNSSVVVAALWKACGDNVDIVTATIESQGELR